MARFQSLVFILLFILPIFMMATDEKDKNPKKDCVFTISTRLGDISFILFDETPLHKANFLKLAEEGFYDGTTFHRVIDNFMVQGGDPATKPDGSPVPVPSSPDGWNEENSVAAEIVPGLKHNRGAVAAARVGGPINPALVSSKSQFYIVQSPNGTPHLDGSYSVYGKVLTGMDVVDAIAKEPGDRAGRPREDITMTVTVNKMSRKKIEKEYGDDVYEY